MGHIRNIGGILSYIYACDVSSLLYVLQFFSEHVNQDGYFSMT